MQAETAVSGGGGAGAGPAGGEGAGVDAGLHDEEIQDGAADGGEAADGFFVVGIGYDGAAGFDEGGRDGGGGEFEVGGDDAAGFEIDRFAGYFRETGDFDGEIVAAGGKEDRAVGTHGASGHFALITGEGGVRFYFDAADEAAVLRADLAFEDGVEGLALGEESHRGEGS